MKGGTVQASVPNGSHVVFQGVESRTPKPPGAWLQGKHSAGNGTATSERFHIAAPTGKWQKRLLLSCHVNDEVDAGGGRESAT